MAVEAARVDSLIDHLVVVADSLTQGVAWCEARFGVCPGPGGQHALMGTHNRLLRIGGPAWPQAYLEIIAIDRDAAAPRAGRARWFGIDDPSLRVAVRTQPQLVHFVAQTSQLAAACDALARQGHDVGRPVAASRRTTLGELRWRITLRDDGVPQHGGGLPALIEWQGPHPAATLPEAGVRLIGLTVMTDQPATLRAAWSAIGLAGVHCALAQGRPRLRARFATPRGEFMLENDPGARQGD